jgi:hypothetical protein
VRRRARIRRGLAVALAAALVLGGALSALAYFTATGTGSAVASVATLPAPSITSTSADAGTVSLSWSAVTAPASGTVAYYVSRDGGAPGGTCPTASAPTSATSCTDSGVSVGTHTYTVTAVWRSWTATSAGAGVQVTYGPATRLVFTTQPAGATAGSPFATQPVVTAKDALGNTVPTYTGTVALAIKSGTGASGATLINCAGTRSGGVTSFSGCEIDKAGTGYVLHASDGALAGDSAAFNVAAGAATQLAFSTQPAGATAGAAFTTQPVVTAKDAFGNVATSYAGTVALAIKSGTGASGATLVHCAGTRSGGVTSFSGCEIDTSGAGYVLHASDGTLAGDSAAFAVSAGALASLVYTTQPGGTITGGIAFPTQPVVTAQDAFGNTATSFAGTVSLAIKQNTGTGGATLSGCSGSLSAGVTTFSGCKIDKSGTGYKLRASASGLVVDSVAFNVAVGPAAIFTITPAGTTVTAGSADNLTIKAFDAGLNAVTSYTGAHSLTFGGASASPSGAQPTVTNSAGTAVAFGTATSITFASGQATVSGSSNGVMVLHGAGSASITVTDGSVSTASGVPVTVNLGTAAKLAWTHVSVSAGTLVSPCLFTCMVNAIGGPGGTFTANVSVTDADGNTVTALGAGHTVTVNGTGGSFTAPSAGSSVSLTISSTGGADSTSAFTFQTQTGGWTSDTLTASSSGYANATATLSKN